LDKEIESAVSHFLNPYFKIGKFYKYNEFKDKLIESMTEAISNGLTDKIKHVYPDSRVKELISISLKRFRSRHKIEVLDGMAWSVDLKKVLKKFFIDFTRNLFKKENEEDLYKTDISTGIKKKELPAIDFSVIFDINLEIEDYHNKLEDLLKESKIDAVEKHMLIKTKVQEFEKVKRKSLIKQGLVPK